MYKLDRMSVMKSVNRYCANVWFCIRLIRSSSQRKHIFRWIKSCQESQFLKQKIPWLTFDSIDFLNTLPLSSKKVFEWGSGGSTLFWLEKGANVVSVEHDRQWYEMIKSTISNMENIDYKLIEPETNRRRSDVSDPSDPESYLSSTSNEQSYYKYVSIIDQYEDNYFDIVLVDGRARPSCIKHAVSKVKIGGLLILDNSDRDYYLSKTSQYLNNFQRVVYTGAVPLSPQFSETSIFKKYYNT